MKKDYLLLKKALNNSDVNKEEIIKSLNFMNDVLYEWLEEGYFSKDFELLMYIIADDYKFTGKMFRGITLLNNCKNNIKNNICFNKPQSFSKDKDIAISFATNCKVTIDDDINRDYDEKDVIPILIELDGKGIGVNLYKFGIDLAYLCNKYISDVEKREDANTLLSYLSDEKEILMFPNDITKCSIKISEL